MQRRTAFAWLGGFAAATMLLTPPASAEVVVGVTEIFVSASVHDGVTVFDGIATSHTFGTTDMFVPVLSGPAHSVDIESGFSAAAMWDYQLTIDLTNFGLPSPTSFPFMEIQLDIKDPGTGSPITDFTVMNGNGTPLTLNDSQIIDGGSILLELDIRQLNLNKDVIILWNQLNVPAPGAMVLLGAAALAGSKRRRR